MRSSVNRTNAGTRESPLSDDIARRAAQLHLINTVGSALRWQTAEGRTIEHRSPAACVSLVDVETITPDTVAHWCNEKLRNHFHNTMCPELRCKKGGNRLPVYMY